VARDHDRSNGIALEKLKIMDAATGALISSTLRRSYPGEGHLVQDFILMNAHGGSGCHSASFIGKHLRTRSSVPNVCSPQ
jgi:hypothetical protein